MLPFSKIVLFFSLAIFRGRVRVKRLTLTRRNLRKEVGSPANQPAPVQDSKPLEDQGMTNSIDSHIDSKMSESDSNDEYEFKAFTASLDSTVIPKNIHIALDCPEWKNVVMEEMRAREKNKTWEICSLPHRFNSAIGSPMAPPCYDFTPVEDPTVVCANQTTKSLCGTSGTRKSLVIIGLMLRAKPIPRRTIRTEAIFSNSLCLIALLPIVIAIVARVWPSP
ncbi:hypothetical protein E5676_scaffold118G00230 [Cucumis melo var. makuwa]|uniref:Reverse transcriptase n=1 Tax=Cucumis melo var. makuwa TaxID=1194695 RepID=A0A5D3CE93_CUCMM|nr:hypothetical protein E5676_scaffold118G00230 [Cucumis melo var. makuwa]